MQVWHDQGGVVVNFCQNVNWIKKVVTGKDPGTDFIEIYRGFRKNSDPDLSICQRIPAQDNGFGCLTDNHFKNRIFSDPASDYPGRFFLASTLEGSLMAVNANGSVMWEHPQGGPWRHLCLDALGRYGLAASALGEELLFVVVRTFARNDLLVKATLHGLFHCLFDGFSIFGDGHRDDCGRGKKRQGKSFAPDLMERSFGGFQ